MDSTRRKQGRFFIRWEVRIYADYLPHISVNSIFYFRALRGAHITWNIAVMGISVDTISCHSFVCTWYLLEHKVTPDGALESEASGVC